MGASFGGWWVAHKDALVAALGLSRDLLHLSIGALAFVALLAVLRSRAVAWFAVLAIECINEAGDLLAAVTLGGRIAWADSASDIALTLLVPTILCTGGVTLAAWLPAAQRRPARRRRAGRRTGQRRARATAVPA